MTAISPPLWRKIQQQNYTKVNELLAFLEISPEQELIDTASSFVLNLPRRLADKIEKGNLADPLFLQFVPLRKERIFHSDYVQDPVCDAAFVKDGQLLQKYKHRALIVTTSACAMHCRYCFRKNFAYDRTDILFDKEIAAISQDHSLREIILSGGDPLSLGNNALKTLLNRLSAIPHLRRIRFHTRFPIGIPERIDDPLLEMLDQCTKQIIFVIHANHPREFDEDIWQALNKIQRLGIPILHQAVLLRGVNDNLAALQELFESLVDHGIMGYYLHQLDRVQGTAHFEVSKEEGKALVAALSKVLPGYAVPKYVEEVPYQPSKTPLT